MPRKRTLDLDEFRKQLEEEKGRLQAHIKRLDDRTSGRDRFNRDTPSRDFDELGGDAASETAERGQVQAVNENFREILDAVNAALDKMDKGTYGVCDRCGKNITKARLEFLPYASLCKNCRREFSG